MLNRNTHVMCLNPKALACMTRCTKSWSISLRIRPGQAPSERVRWPRAVGCSLVGHFGSWRGGKKPLLIVVYSKMPKKEKKQNMTILYSKKMLEKGQENLKIHQKGQEYLEIHHNAENQGRFLDLSVVLQGKYLLDFLMSVTRKMLILPCWMLIIETKAMSSAKLDQKQNLQLKQRKMMEHQYKTKKQFFTTTVSWGLFKFYPYKGNEMFWNKRKTSDVWPALSP